MTNYLIRYLLTYIKDGHNQQPSHDNGFCNFFDIGYYEGSWHSVLTNKIKPTAVRFDDDVSPTKIICEGVIAPGQIIVEQYTDKDFFIRVLDANDNSTCIAEVRMNTPIENYFREHLSDTIEILLQWEISFN